MNRNSHGTGRAAVFAVGMGCLLTPAAAWAGDIGLVANGDFEGGSFNTGHAATCGVSSSLLPQAFGWNKDAVPEGSSCGDNCFNATEETAIRRSGGRSARLSFCTNGSSAVAGAISGIKGVIVQTVVVGPNASFRVKAWALHTSGNCPPILAWNPGTDANIESANDAVPARITRIDPDDAWATLNRWQSATLYGTLTGGEDRITVMVGGAAHDGSAGANVYIDDVEVTVLASSLQNASFEAGLGGNGPDSAGNGGYNFEHWDVGAAGSKQALPVRGTAGQGTGSPGSPPDGLHYAYADACGDAKSSVISQVVSVTPGSSYTLSAQVYQHAGSDADPPRIGYMNGTATFRTAEPIFANSVVLGVQGSWQPLTLTFTPTQPTVTLILFGKHTNASCWSAYFDRVTFGPACTAPAITGQPGTQRVCPGESASFTVVASGSAPFTYQWSKGTTLLTDGGNISGATTATLTINPVTATDVGANYRCVVTNACGSATSNNGVLNVNTPVRIVTQPTSTSACPGGSATFRVSAFSSPTSSYQWRRGTTNLVNGGNISGATSSVLTINPVSGDDAGDDYNCVVTNVCGGVTTDQVSLTVITPPVITAQPASQMACTGSSATFTVAVASVQPPSYQWRRGTTNLVNGGSISGANTATLTINPVISDDADAAYNCVVTNACGTATSSHAALSIDFVPPTIICPPDVQTGSSAAWCGATVNLGTPVANDNCGTLDGESGTGGTVTATRADGAPLTDPYPVGTTTVTWVATDVNGLSTSCDQTVTVVDNQPPVITACAAPQTVSAGSDCSAVVPDLVSGVDVADACSPLNGLTRSQDPPAGTPVGSGATRVTLTISDAAGNLASCSTTFTVNDTTAPAVTCRDATITLDSSGQATLAPAQVMQNVIENCGFVQRSLSRTAFDCIDIGQRTVTLTVRDAAGNEGSCDAVVTVQDTDSDGDGVGDCSDLCDNDPGKTAPGQCGCGNPDLDSDGDGTAECNDGCPSDPQKTAPGVCGCGISDVDTDGDGHSDCVDDCPADAAKVQPGICGCGVADTDRDSDGTADCHDQCPDDSHKSSPGACGCGLADTDRDADGTADCHDQCPDDPAKTLPGVCGCGTPDTDSDGDGTPNCQDQCPDAPHKTLPGICGCSIADTDTDGDLVVDCLDACPADPAKTAPGTCGCGASDADSDADGALDCHDACPNDPLKIGPGVCGCGVVDKDTDADGAADCQDACPNDPAKRELGACGCGVPDVDSDQDAAPDCVDLCPADPAKTAPGACGCGLPETDTDQDGTPDCIDGCPTDPNKTEPGDTGCGGQAGRNTDTDGDGIPDRKDRCPTDPGKKAPGQCGCGTPDTDNDSDGVANCRDNCPDHHNPSQRDRDRDGIGDACDADCAALLIQAERLIVTRGRNGSVQTVPVAGMEVRVFDRFEGSCARSFGFSSRHYADIYKSCPPVASGTTAADGSVRFGLPAGTYLVIGQYDPDGFPANHDGDERYVGVSVASFTCSADRDPQQPTVRKRLQVIEESPAPKPPPKRGKNR